MESNQLKGSWAIVKGKIKEKWAELTDDDINEIDGKKDQLIGKIQQKYGQTKEQVQQMVEEFDQSSD